MDDSKKLTKRLAELGMIYLSEQEIDQMAEDVKDITKFLDKIKEADVKGVKEEKAIIDYDSVRKDEAHPSMDREALLKNAVKKEGDSFSVAKVVE